MSAITLELEDDLVRKVASLKSKDESISSFIRSLIEREHRAHELHTAASLYQLFLDENPEEQKAMESWAGAALSEEIEPRRR